MQAQRVLGQVTTLFKAALFTPSQPRSLSYHLTGSEVGSESDYFRLNLDPVSVLSPPVILLVPWALSQLSVYSDP